MIDWIKDILHELHSQEGLKHLIYGFGLMALVGIVFAETGLLIGFFLPGDSLLFLAGMSCAENLLDKSQPPPLDYVTMCTLLTLAAIAGDWVNFWLGKATGVHAWSRPDGRFIKRRYLLEAQAFYERHGGIALAAARFIPIARTFVPFVAGVSRMPFRSFMWWNVGGALVWVWSVAGAGYWFGQLQFVKDHLQLIILSIIGISVLPVVIGVARRLISGPPAPVVEPAVVAPTAPAAASAVPVATETADR